MYSRTMYTRTRAVTMALVALVALGACGGDAPTSPLGEVVWESCRIGLIPGQCADVAVPLDWDDPDGATITVHVERLRSRVEAPVGQLWLLAGGPGQAGSVLGRLGRSVQEVAPGFDIYLPDYRGSGQSTPFGCNVSGDLRFSDPGLVDAAADCASALEARWGDDLRHFRTTADAHDIVQLSRAERRPGDLVFAHGISFGGARAHRILQLYPDELDGVIFESPAANGKDWLAFDLNAEGAVRRRMASCGADAECAARLGSDPWATWTDTFAQIQAGHCPTAAGLDEWAYRDLFTRFAQQQGGALPALVHRVRRCEAGDEAILERLAADLVPTPPVEGYDASLHLHVLYQEFVPRPAPSADELWAMHQPLPYGGPEPVVYREMMDVWPSYAQDPLASGRAETDTPTLTLVGDLDMQTPLEEVVSFYGAFDGPGQTLVEVPGGGHGALFLFPLDTEGKSCGAELVSGFIADPTGPLDTSCTTRLVAPGFESNARRVFGVDDLWDNP